MLSFFFLALFLLSLTTTFSQAQAQEQQQGCPQCTCPLNSTNNNNNNSNNNSSNDDDDDVISVHILLFDSPGIIAMVRENARDYQEHVRVHRPTQPPVQIHVQTTPTMPELYAEIESDARTGGGLFDAYFTNPVIMGTAAVLGGFMDLTSAIVQHQQQQPQQQQQQQPQQQRDSEWTDVLPVFRTHVTNFEDKIYMILLDGDTHAMFYRRDVLEHFGLTVPRTWDEYIAVAKAVHGQVYENITLSGSCISRIYGDHAQYWAHLVLSTITQTNGPEQGSLFDTNDLTPLTGEAMAEMLRIHEEMAEYGTPDGAFVL